MTKKNKNQFDMIETFIGADTVLTGNLSTDKTIRIDGKMTGNIEKSAGVILGDCSFVKGNINSVFVIVSGAVEGNISAAESIELLNKSKVTGNIETKMISISEGAVFDGKSTMIKTEETAQNNEKEAN